MFIVIAASCASTNTLEKGGPRGMRSSEHLTAAQEHEEAARDKSTWPVTTAAMPGAPVPTPVAMPWYRTWDTSADQRRLAREHRAHAAALQSAFDEACRDVAVERVRRSPLESFGVGGWPTAAGAIVYLDAKVAGSPEMVMAHLRCHRAWMMLAPAMDMDDCALDLPGLQVDARGDDSSITLSLTVRDSKLIPELQRRVAKQLEH